MTLDEAFEKYSDEIILKRPTRCLPHDIKWLKQMKIWGNEESRKLGFFIPESMIEDANADDWEIYNETTV